MGLCSLRLRSIRRTLKIVATGIYATLLPWEERYGELHIIRKCVVLLQEFKAIGIKKQGLVLRLEKAAKKLPAKVIETDVPVSVSLQALCDPGGLTNTHPLL